MMSDIKLQYMYWGPLVTKSIVDNHVITELLKRGEIVRNLNNDARDGLAGHIDNEFNYKDEDRKWFMSNVGHHFNSYIKYKETEWKKQTPKVHSLELDTLWINYMKKNEFNPPHYHKGYLSFVLYLQVPEIIKEDAKKFKSASEGPGAIEFLYGQEDRLGDYICSHIKFPKVGELYIFPSNLYHTVHPFRSDVERISISGNLMAKFKENKEGEHCSLLYEW